jgi:ABC-type bacteriocin/lantibiotic exporter with double-glycine peptidase domain
MNAIRALLPLLISGLLLWVNAAAADQIALPWIKQKTETECGRAVLASVAARHGGEAETFYRQLPAPPDRRRGYSILQLQKFGAKIGVDLSLIQPEGITIAGECSERPALKAYFSRLEKLIDAGHAVIVPIGNAASRGHYLVLVGVKDGNFTALDPSTPERKKISATELRSMMCGFGYVALAIVN